jgi:hypothetical protein
MPEDLEQRRRHARNKLREQSNRSRHVPIAEVNEVKIPGGKAPFRHDFDEATTAHRFRLYQRRQIADAAARLEAPASDRKNHSSRMSARNGASSSVSRAS